MYQFIGVLCEGEKIILATLKLTDIDLSLLQDDYIAWPSWVWQDHSIVGFVWEAKQFSKGLLFEHLF